MINIICMGDSLTKGFGVQPDESYPSLLGKQLNQTDQKYVVQNMGVNGETSREALLRCNDVIANAPDLVLLETGINDGLHMVPAAVISQNIGLIIQRMQEHEIQIILMGMELIWGEAPAYIREFNQIYPALAKQYYVPLIPPFLSRVIGNPEFTLADGIHPNHLGYERIVTSLLPEMKNILNE